MKAMKSLFVIKIVRSDLKWTDIDILELLLPKTMTILLTLIHSENM